MPVITPSSFMGKTLECYCLPHEKERITRFDKGVEPLNQNNKVTLMLHTNHSIIKPKAGALN
jgi:hypothetical protein